MELRDGLEGWGKVDDRVWTWLGAEGGEGSS